MSDKETITCELAVIGTGMAGMAAALFAANRGISVVQVGNTGGIIFASGFLDLMGVHPIKEKKRWSDPWAAIDALTRDVPAHPYAHLKKEDIRAGVDEFLSFLEESGLPYHRRTNWNVEALTSIGTTKPTYCVPRTMWAGIKALEERSPCLIVDFHKLKGFSARQIRNTLGAEWPGLRTTRVAFPGFENLDELYAEQMARALDFSEETREKLAQAVRPHVKDARYVGMPAILGVYHSDNIAMALEKQIGVPIFEIPTLPPGVPGLRLREILEQQMPRRKVRLFSKKTVFKAEHQAGGFMLHIGNMAPEETVRAKRVILASGRFLGKGLRAGRKRIQEAIFDLSVFQPSDRKGWHCRNFLDPQGHPVNQVGLEIDDEFRPLNSTGDPAFRTLFAAGSILAHQDWMRMKCGSGLAIATAYRAVNACLKMDA